jgi:hypothetical protein
MSWALTPDVRTTQKKPKKRSVHLHHRSRWNLRRFHRFCRWNLLLRLSNAEPGAEG